MGKSKSDNFQRWVLFCAAFTVLVSSVAHGQAGVSITETGGSTSVSETGPTSDTYTVTLDSIPTADVDIVADPDVQTDLGAGAGIGVLLTFTSGNWNVPQTITVTAVDDALVEGTHNSTIPHTATSADSAYDGIGIPSVIAQVTDNDSVGVTITPTGGSTAVSELGPTSDSYTLVLTSMPSATVTISVDPDNETDLGNGAGSVITINISPGTWNIARTIIVTAVDDAVPEGPHTSTIVHTATSADAGYNGVSIPNLTVNVTDDDAAGVTIAESGGSTDVNEAGPTSDTYTITLDKQPSSDVTITATPDAQVDLGSGAGVAVTFVFAVGNWNVARNVTVTAVDDIVDEGPATSTIAHSATSADTDYNGISIANVVANIADNDLAGVAITASNGMTDVSELSATSDTYTIVLDSPPTATVTIQVDPDIQSDVGAGTGSTINLSFTGGNWNTPQTVTVTAVDDAIAEGAHTSTITHSATSSDLNYDGITIASVVANVTDNDTAGVSNTESANATTVSEQGPTSDTYTVVLTSQPTANVVVAVDPDIETSVGGGAGVTSNLTFTPANWSTPQTVTVSAVDDFIIEGNHNSTIAHTAASADGNYNAIAITNVVATVADNDAAGVTISESGGSTDVSEIGPTSDTYTLVLDSQPNADVTITVTPDTETDLGSAQALRLRKYLPPRIGTRYVRLS